MKTKVILEFSERWLKAAFLEIQGAGRVQIKGLFLEPVDPNAQNFSEALTSVFKQVGKKTGVDVVLVISRNKVTVRKIDLPSRDSSEIEQMLGLHVIRHVPYSKEEIIWGYQNLGFDGISNSHILLAIAHRDVLRSIFNAFVPLNMLPENMLLSSQGIVHYARDLVKDKSLFHQTCLILDVDYNSCDLMLISKQQLNSSVVIAQGAKQLEPEESRVKFLAELKQALLAFRSELSQTKNAVFFLTGAAGAIAGIDKYFEAELNLKVQILESKAISDFKLSSKDVSFSSVIGFGASQKKEDICFTLPEVQIKKEMRRKIKQFLILGICLVYIFIILGLIAFSTVSQRQSYLGKINSAVQRLKSKNEGLVDISHKVNMSRQYMDKKDTALNYLYELNTLCPENVTLTNFNWEKSKGLVIRGYAYQIPDIFSFVNILDKSQLFKGMKTRSTRRRKVKAREVVEFEIGAK